MNKFRTEKDLLGKKEIPHAAYWGIHTARARDNFAISGRPVHPDLIKALAQVKKACSQTNAELKYLHPDKAAAMIRACDEIMAGEWSEQFIVDALQGGAGTSTNMNINEVIANRALEILGRPKGEYDQIHPIEDANLHQSTNDVYPTALKIATIEKLHRLEEKLTALQGAFQVKEKTFAGILKIGRTEMQPAVPMTLGLEFAAFAEAIARDRWRTFKCEERIRVVNIGGTAVGTGLTAPRQYIFRVIEKLRENTRLSLARGENLTDATANSDPLVEVSGLLKTHAQNLIKISNDLRLLHLLGEIQLPQKQAGSSIMPGKVNPVILEATIQAALAFIAYDRLITDCAAHATLQINEFLPLLADSLLNGLDYLIQTDDALIPHVSEIKARPDTCVQNAEAQTTLITAFIPFIGYTQATELLKEFEKTSDKNFRRFLDLKLGKELTDKILSPFNLTSLGYRDDEKDT